jgi:two-component system CheB/CheR fusion protein
MFRVLVIEDDPDTAVSSAMLLRLQGCEVDIAVDGPNALQAVQERRPHVVLLDLGLPGMDGWQVAQQIRQCRTEKRRPLIVAMSGHGTKAV